MSIGGRLILATLYAQRPKKAPAAMRTPTMVAPIPVMPRAPLLPPLKAPVAVVAGEFKVDELDPGVDVLLIEVEREGVLPVLCKVGEVESKKDEGNTYTEDKEPVPEVEEDKEELEEMGSLISNELVWERTSLTFPVGEAWRVYPELQSVSVNFR